MKAFLVAVLLAACGQEGTISFTLVFPPGTTRLPAGTTTVRLSLDAPAATREAPVAADGGFSLDLSVPAQGGSGSVTLEALDAGGNVLARGVSPPLPIAAYDGRFVLYMAPPGQWSEAPVSLDPARAELAVANAPLGLLVAGGRRADGQRADDLAIYSAYTHTLTSGAALPEARAGLSAASGSFGIVYLFGGLGTGEVPASDLWRFDSNVAPGGTYTALTSDPTLARAGAAVAPLGGERFLVTGSPPALLDGPGSRIVAFANAPAEAGQATTATTGGTAVVLAGPSGLFRYDIAADQFAALDGPARSEQAAVALPGGDVLVVGGSSRDALRVSLSGTVTVIPELTATRRRPAVAVAGDKVVVAGGYDEAGSALPDSELFDATTLAPAGAAPLVAARGEAVAGVLPNGTILLIGGRAAEGGAPVGTLEIFTP